MYSSFLICEYEKIVNFYKNGLEVATFHKDTGEFVNKDKTGVQDLKDALTAFGNAFKCLQDKGIGVIHLNE